MMKRNFWLPILIGIVLTPLVFMLGAFMSGGGHDVTILVALFPFAMLLGMLAPNAHWAIAWPLMALQFPIYGLAFGAASMKNRFRPLIIGLLVAHFLAVIAYVALSYSSNN